MDTYSKQSDDLGLSKAKRWERFIELSRQQHEEDLVYWRTASDKQRGQTLYQLLMLVHAIGRYPEKTEMFPGFPAPKSLS